MMAQLFVQLWALACLVLVACIPASGADYVSRYNATVITSSDGMCPTAQQQDTALNQIHSDVLTLLREQPLACGGVGWKTVAFVNMSDPTEVCPGTWTEVSNGQQRACGKQSTAAGCDPELFSTGGEEYNEVCGRIFGHQYSSTDGFAVYHAPSPSIDDPYVDGVSVTHGTPRIHIWTHAAGYSEIAGDPPSRCPCDNFDGGPLPSIPSFVGEDYFCETGYIDHSAVIGDTLWDGQDCGACCTFNSPPWFSVALPSSTSDDIELRICCDEPHSNEDVYIELLELYVK